MSRKKASQAEVKLYFMMNKSSGTVCSTVSDRRHTVYEAFSNEDLVSPEGARLHSVGRLDADTEGLLLFTNDGKFSNFLTRPENNVPKKYVAGLLKKVPENSCDECLCRADYIQRAFEGLVLPAEKKAPEQQSGSAVIEFLSDAEKDVFAGKADAADFCFITVTEGKFHEVKRIFKALGNEVVFLKRVSFGGLELDENLKSGEVRKLTEEELKRLDLPMVTA